MGHSLKRGFATIYIVLILSSLMIAILIITEISSGFAADSFAEAVCVSAGESVLGEYNVQLFNRYGIFALRNYEDDLEKLASHYIEGSLEVKRGLLRLSLDKLYVYTDKYPALDTNGLLSQIQKLSLPAVAKRRNECAARETRSAGAALLPSKILGFGSRESVLLSGGIIEIGLKSAQLDEYIMQMCSFKNGLLDDTYLAYEIEYILFGYSSDELNLASMRRSLYAARLADYMAKHAESAVDPVSLAAAAAAGTVKAEADVEAIAGGGQVDEMNYEKYLRLFLSMLKNEEKIARLMDIMQLNINNIDGNSLSFSNYCYGFDLHVELNKRVIAPIAFGFDKRYRITEQTHVYK